MIRYLAFVGLVLCIALAQSSSSQDRFDSGPNKGFRRANPESIMVEIEKPFEARTVQGVIKDPAGEPLPETHFEIRDASGKVRSAKTDKTGRFRIPRVAEGSYSFKATRDGFQSMVGKVVVSTQSIHKAYIELTMRLGV